MAIGLAALGLTLPPPLDRALPGDASLAAPTPPLWSRSRYMETVDTSLTYQRGCEMGNLVDQGDRPADGLVILMFGMPIHFGESSYGASLYNGPDQTTKPIRLAVQEFGHGYWACTDGNNGKLTIAVSTSNYGSDVSFEHGRSWAKMVNTANRELKEKGWSRQVVVIGGIDLELSWSSPSRAEKWLDGYDKENSYRVVNFGDAAGCPPASSSCGTSSHPEWTQHQVWWAAWGHPGVFPVPQIYRTDGIMAEQWHQVAHRGIDDGGTLMLFSGALTQWDACQDRGCDPSVENRPEDGWAQLWTSVNDLDGTDQGIKWSTDISWKN
jgi:hypothetical protein